MPHTSLALLSPAVFLATLAAAAPLAAQAHPGAGKLPVVIRGQPVAAPSSSLPRIQTARPRHHTAPFGHHGFSNPRFPGHGFANLPRCQRAAFVTGFCSFSHRRRPAVFFAVPFYVPYYIPYPVSDELQGTEPQGITPHIIEVNPGPSHGAAEQLDIEHPDEGIVRLTRPADGRTLEEVQFFVADSSHRALTTQTVREAPYTALFDVSPRVAYVGATVVYADGVRVTTELPYRHGGS
ncbi:MAG TPA: hypothetical protein VFW98_07580 [Gemmatimonadaceae bacterium]|nr:hypothetical protein [Gemmatimonadaceae bacterium]